MTSPMRNRTFKADDELWRALREAAAYNGEDVSSALRRLAWAYVDRTTQKREADAKMSPVTTRG